MLFNSLHFLLFFPCVAVLFFVIPHRVRWAFLLAASYGFYMCWRPEYLVLIVLITVVCYLAALLMEATESKPLRRLALVGNLFICLAVLFLFKYLPFATQSANWLSHALGWSLELPYWEFLLPVGISFYTFQALSYSLDVYQGKRAHERHLGIFSLYVAFFPQLVAGPIERSTNLMPQFREKMSFDYERVVSGLRWMLWGMFKKVVVADNLARFVNTAYGSPGESSGGSMALATLFFSLQIYCDFSGYSDIAIGAARVMGFRLMRNFDTPYFSRSFSEFWRRWHISLSTWFRDYVYIPLGGSRHGQAKTYRNCAIVFLISGLWHGAAWTFVVWGGIHGALLIAESLLRRRLAAPDAGRVLGALRRPGIVGLVRRGIVFLMVTLSWVFFRAASLPQAFAILKRIGQSLLALPQTIVNPDPSALGMAIFMGHSRAYMAIALFGAGSMVLGDALLSSPRSRQAFHAAPHSLRMLLYFALVISILLLGAIADETPFIYFQF